MRVEKIFEFFLGKEISSNFSRPVFVGMYFHIPLIILGFIIAKFTKTIGFHWLSLLIVASELLIVITRFVFSYEQTFMGDLVRYWYAGLFLFASAYTLYEDGHVRVDIIYQGLKEKTKNLVNCFGSILLGWSTSIVIILLCFYGKQSIVNSPVANFEVTQQGSVGMFIKYHMAVFLAIFGITMLIQFISYFLSQLLIIKMKKEKNCRNFYKSLIRYGIIIFSNTRNFNGNSSWVRLSSSLCPSRICNYINIISWFNGFFTRR